MMRKFGQEIIKATAGKKVHGTGAIPGGINKNLSIAERDELLADIGSDDRVERGKAVEIARGYTLENLDDGEPSSAPSTRTICPSCATTARWTSTTATCGPSTPSGETGSSTRSNPLDYLDVIAEEVRPWSYMKFPFLKQLGPEDGWFRVGPLARLNACDFIDTPGGRGRRGRNSVPEVTDGQAEQRDDGLPLGAHDRAAALDARRSRPAERRRPPG